MEVAILILVCLTLLSNVIIATALWTLIGSKRSQPASQEDRLMQQIRQQLPMAMQRQQAPIMRAPNAQVVSSPES